ncbi:MAG: oligosaccharide flippase family protein [Lachnoclostridium sp.]|nr:oligosaccharide flippase family protein [Lachnospira sp.]MCM1247217.1 oligosaccharide flippase family protein [Lachnoclostridium sp.]MCM1534562.1 oligosaccharide flippase family protein [Clostridium sp.]
MSDDKKNKVIKAGIGFLVGNYLIKGISFLMTPIFSRLLQPRDFGIFSSYTAYESMLYLFAGLTLHSCLKNAKYRYKDDYENFCLNCLSVAVLSSLFLAGIVLLWNKQLVQVTGFSKNILFLLVLHSFATAICTFYNTYVSLEYNAKKYLKIAFLNAVSNMMLSLFLILFFFEEDKYVGRIIGTAFPLIVIALFIFAGFFFRHKLKLRKEYIVFALGYSLPIIPHGLSQVILGQADRLMIKEMAGSTEAGIYSLGYTLYTLIFLAANSIGNVWEPWFYERMNEKEYAPIKHNSIILISAVAIVTVVAFMISPELIEILGGEGYEEAKRMVIPIILGGFFSFLYTIPAGVEYFYGKTKLIAVGSVLAAVINIILNYLFIPLYGYHMAAYTTAVTYFLYFSFHYLFSILVNKGRCIFNSKGIGLIIGILLLCAWLADCLRNEALVRWSIAVVLGVLFVISVWKFIFPVLKRKEVREA